MLYPLLYPFFAKEYQGIPKKKIKNVDLTTFYQGMQRNNGAGGSLKNLIKIGPERFVVSFCVFFLKNWLKSRLEPVLKSTCIIPQIPI